MGYPYPQNPYPGYRTTQDDDHLRTLSVLHYVYGAIVGLASLVGLIYVAIGVGIAASIHSPGGEIFGGIFAVIGLVIVAVIGIKAALVFYAGYCLGKRKHHTFCFVVACFSCLWLPIGTLLGVFTLVVLSRPTVKPMFAP